LTIFELNKDLLAFKMIPAFEKTLSLGILVAEAAKIS